MFYIEAFLGRREVSISKKRYTINAFMQPDELLVIINYVSGGHVTHDAMASILKFQGIFPSVWNYDDTSVHMWYESQKI